MEISDLMNYLFVFGIGFARMLAVLSMVPIFQSSVLPGVIRTAVAMSLTLAAYPIFATDAKVMDFPTLTLLGLAVKEVVIGVTLGFGAAVMFWAIESTGFFIDNQRGSTMASSVDPLTGSQTSPLGIFLTQVLTVFFMVGGGMFALLLAVYQSYKVFPVFEFYPRMSLEASDAFLGVTDHIMAIAILMAAPAMIAMFLSEFGLGLVSRFAPQLNVFFLAMPVKSAVGILMLVLYIGLLQEIWQDQFALIFDHLDLLQSIMR